MLCVCVLVVNTPMALSIYGSTFSVVAYGAGAATQTRISDDDEVASYIIHWHVAKGETLPDGGHPPKLKRKIKKSSEKHQKSKKE